MKLVIIIFITVFNLFASNGFINSSDLKAILTEDNLVIIDVSDKHIYEKGHITNAKNADLSLFLKKNIKVDPETILEPDLNIY
jgi:rhodanese-related sulfurtransferase